MQHKTLQNILWTMNKTKYFFFENSNKIDRSLAVLRKEKTEVTKIRFKSMNIIYQFYKQNKDYKTIL